jgi:phospholipase A1
MDRSPFTHLAPCLALALPAAALAQPAAAPDIRARIDATTAWQACLGQTDAARLACFDGWARGQQRLIEAIEHKAQSVETSPTRNEAPSAQAAAVRGDVAQALASAQPQPAAGTPATGSAGIVGVGLEQGCRDRQFSELSRFWELESGSSCPTFGLRAFHPTTASIAAGDHINRQPSSPNPANSAASAIDYGKREMRLALSVRTKLASGLFTPADGTLRDSLWAAYTQQSYWQVFNGGLSRPFRNTDHMPELIYVYPTTLKLPGGWLWRYSGWAWRTSPTARATAVAQLEPCLPDGWLRARQPAEPAAAPVEAPARDRAKDNNPDLVRHLGRGDVTLGWNVDAKNTLRATYTGSFRRHGSTRLEWTRSLGDGWGNSFSGLRLYTALFHGHGDSLLDYNFRRTVFSIGLSLVDF